MAGYAYAPPPPPPPSAAQGSRHTPYPGVQYGRGGHSYRGGRGGSHGGRGGAHHYGPQAPSAHHAGAAAWQAAHQPAHQPVPLSAANYHPNYTNQQQPYGPAQAAAAHAHANANANANAHAHANAHYAQQPTYASPQYPYQQAPVQQQWTAHAQPTALPYGPVQPNYADRSAYDSRFAGPTVKYEYEPAHWSHAGPSYSQDSRPLNLQPGRPAHHSPGPDAGRGGRHGRGRGGSRGGRHNNNNNNRARQTTNRDSQHQHQHQHQKAHQGANNSNGNKKKRKTNTLGLTPAIKEESESEDDEDEERTLEQLLGADSFNIKDVAAFIAERKKNYPTRARVEAKKAAAAAEKDERRAANLEKKADRLREQLAKIESSIKRKREPADEGDEMRASDSDDDEPEIITSKAPPSIKPAATPLSGQQKKADVTKQCKYYSTGGTCGKKNKCRFVHDDEVRAVAIKEREANEGRLTIQQRLTLNDMHQQDLSILETIYYLQQKGAMKLTEIKKPEVKAAVVPPKTRLLPAAPASLPPTPPKREPVVNKNAQPGGSASGSASSAPQQQSWLATPYSGSGKAADADDLP